MNAKHVILSIVGVLILTTLPRGAAGAAETCDRQCLFGFVEQYLAAMVAHDPSKAPIAAGAKYTENGQKLDLPDGIWRIATKVRPYRNLVAEPERGGVGGFAVVEENGVPSILGFRLKVADGKITEMENIVIRKEPGGFANPDNLVTPRPDFARIEPADTRRSRDELVRIANTYFSALQKNDGSIHPPFADDCNRLENGTQTTNNQSFKSSSGTVGPASMTCAKAFGLGYYREDFAAPRPALADRRQGTRGRVRRRVLRSRCGAQVLQTHQRPGSPCPEDLTLDLGNLRDVQDPRRHDRRGRSGRERRALRHGSGLGRLSSALRTVIPEAGLSGIFDAVGKPRYPGSIVIGPSVRPGSRLKAGMTPKLLSSSPGQEVAAAGPAIGAAEAGRRDRDPR